MNFVTEILPFALISGVAAIVIVFLIYRRKLPLQLPAEKPSLAFFPKYYISLPLNDGPNGSLETVMVQKGFRAVEHESGKKTFERGSFLGSFSFSTNWMKLRISEMEGSPARLSIAYGTTVLFDTGDLWKFAKEIERILIS